MIIVDDFISFSCIVPTIDDTNFLNSLCSLSTKAKNRSGKFTCFSSLESELEPILQKKKP